MSRESICIALTYAYLNHYHASAYEIQNTYLQAPSLEKDYVACGPKFGLESGGKHAIIVRALCGGKSPGADYWRQVHSAMEGIGFSSCNADPNVWLPHVLKSNGVEHF